MKNPKIVVRIAVERDYSDRLAEVELSEQIAGVDAHELSGVEVEDLRARTAALVGDAIGRVDKQLDWLREDAQRRRAEAA